MKSRLNCDEIFDGAEASLPTRPHICHLFFFTIFLTNMRQQSSSPFHVNAVFFTKLFQHHSLFFWNPQCDKKDRESIVNEKQEIGGNKHPGKLIHYEDCIHGMANSAVRSTGYKFMVCLKFQCNAPAFVKNIVNPC